MMDKRPWGYFTVLEDNSEYKVKRIVVYPGKRLSLQKHQQRQEHWFVVAGEGRATLDQQEMTLSPGQAIDIPQQVLHRMANLGERDLVFIEIQTGSYFGEDDIERLEDDYGRGLD